MSTKIGIGFSNNLNPEKAAREAAFNTKSHLGNDKIDLAIILSSVHYDPKKILTAINKILNAKRTIGCSTAGIILAESVQTQGIAILAICSQEIQFGIGSIETKGFPETYKAGSLLAQNCIADYGKHNRTNFIYFTDNRLQNCSAFLRGLQEILGKVFPIIGASSSTDFHFLKNFQLFENQVLQHAAIGALLGGNLSLGIGSSHGWKPLGKPRIASETDGNIIKTIDGKKASLLYEEYFPTIKDEKEAQIKKKISMFYPLGILIKETNNYLLRNISKILPDGSIVCQGDVPANSTIHIMISNKTLCTEAALKAAQQASENLRNKEPKVIFIIESMAHLKLMGKDAAQETDKIKEIFSKNVPIIGMYSNTEAYPFMTQDKIMKTHIQNESIIVLAIS